MNLIPNLPRAAKDFLYTLSGVLISGFALKSFLIPNNFLDGGVTGVSLLLHEIYHWPIAIVILLLNIPFVIAGGFHVNRAFAFKMLASIVGLGICLVLLPYPVITSDKLLVSIFGGFFLA